LDRPAPFGRDLGKQKAATNAFFGNEPVPPDHDCVRIARIDWLERAEHGHFNRKVSDLVSRHRWKSRVFGRRVGGASHHLPRQTTMALEGSEAAAQLTAPLDCHENAGRL